ncbi:hypothetical protein BDR03DRAFT_950948 [Suillus americanus]|nr:hypothetical protein BDR03DRAFT_950948 [Suillus americanus]
MRFALSLARSGRRATCNTWLSCCAATSTTRGLRIKEVLGLVRCWSSIRSSASGSEGWKSEGRQAWSLRDSKKGAKALRRRCTKELGLRLLSLGKGS